MFGCLSKNNNKKCILYIPGLTGNFFESKFPREIADESIKRGYDFLFSHNQGSFQIIDFPFLREDGKLKSKTKGATYEKFEDCVFDIDRFWGTAKYDFAEWFKIIKFNFHSFMK